MASNWARVIDGNAVKSLSLASADGWESIIGTQHKKGAWGSAYWNGVVLKRAAMTRAIPRRLVTPGGDEVEERDAGIRWQDGIGGMLYRASISLDRFGAAYFVVVPNRGGGVHSVRWVDPASIYVDFDEAKGVLRGFRRHIGRDVGAYFEYDEDTGRTESWNGLRLGFVWSLGLNEVGPGYALEDLVQLPASLLNSSDAVMKALFDRGAIAQHVVFAPHQPPKEERNRVLAALRRVFFGGVDKSNNVEVLSRELEIEKIGIDPSSLALTDVDEGNMADVSAVAQLPRVLLDPDVGANKSTLDRVSSNFIMDTILPHAEHIAGAFNDHVLTDVDLELELTPESMTINQEDEKLRANAFALYVSQGVPKETAAAILGIDVPEGLTLGPDAADMVQAAPAASPVIEEVDPDMSIDDDGEAKRAEMAQFRRWYKKRMGADVNSFEAKYITKADKLLAVDDILRTAWDTYP